MGGALESGDDLRLKLKGFKASARKVAIAVALALMFSLVGPMTPRVVAAEPAPARQIDSRELDASSRELDASIGRVLERREYTWRLPREKSAQPEKSWLSSVMEDFFKSISRSVEDVWKKAWEIQEKLQRWFRGDKESNEDGMAGGWNLASAAGPLLYTVLALSLVGILVWVIRRGKKVKPVIAKAQALVPTPDLHSENLLADHLPEDEWIKLARELMNMGELRLALRASYLAGLAHLGSRDLITIKRHKSNRDYDRELSRRARPQEALLAAFHENMEVFECAWYGLHEVTLEILGRFQQNLERIRAC